MKRAFARITIAALTLTAISLGGGSAAQAASCDSSKVTIRASYAYNISCPAYIKHYDILASGAVKWGTNASPGHYSWQAMSWANIDRYGAVIYRFLTLV